MSDYFRRINAATKRKKTATAQQRWLAETNAATIRKKTAAAQER